jgi:hypothetical protein
VFDLTQVSRMFPLFSEIGLGEAHPLRLEWIQVLLKAGQKPTQWVALNIRPQIN